MITNLLSGDKLVLPILLASFAAAFKNPLTFVSNSTSLLFPVEFSKTPKCNWSIKFSTSFFLALTAEVIFLFVSASAIKSLIPTL